MLYFHCDVDHAHACGTINLSSEFPFARIEIGYEGSVDFIKHCIITAQSYAAILALANVPFDVEPQSEATNTLKGNERAMLMDQEGPLEYAH